MRQRLAIAISSLVAAGVLAVGLSAAGFGPGSTVAGDDQSADAALASSDGQLEAAEPEVVYVKPAPPPKTVVKVKRTKSKANRANTRQTTTVRSVEREHEREDDHEREREHEYEREDD